MLPLLLGSVIACAGIAKKLAVVFVMLVNPRPIDKIGSKN